MNNIIIIIIIMTMSSFTSSTNLHYQWPKPNAATNSTKVKDLTEDKPADATKNGMPPFSDHLLLNTNTDCPTNNATLQCSGRGVCIRQKKEWISSFKPQTKGFIMEGHCKCNRNYIGTGCETYIYTLPQNYIDELILNNIVRKTGDNGYKQTTKGRVGIPVHSLFGERHYTTNNNPNKALIDPNVIKNRVSIRAGQPERIASLDKWTYPSLQAILPLSKMEATYHSLLRNHNEHLLKQSADAHVTKRTPNSTDRMGLYTNWKGRNILAPVLTPDQAGVHVLTTKDVDKLKPQAKLSDVLEAEFKPSKQTLPSNNKKNPPK